MIITRSPLVAALALAFVVVFGVSTFDAKAATGQKILQVGNAVEPEEIDPQVVSGLYEARIARSVFEGLVREDGNEKIVPATAERWDISADGRVYTFHLRKNARWSNGMNVTAKDFVRSYERILSPLFAAQLADRLYWVVGAEDFNRGKITDFSLTGFKALNDNTLEITLNGPVPFLLRLLCRQEWFPVPMDVIQKVGTANRKGNRWSRPETFVGNGPFVLKSWRTQQKIIVARSTTYWDSGSVKLDEIHFHPDENANTEERMFRAGQLHITSMIPAAKIATYRKDTPAALRLDPVGSVYSYIFNVRRAPFNDVRVRRAFSLAIDRETLVRNVTQAGEKPAYHLIPPGLTGYAGHPSFESNVAAARQLLSAAGFSEGKGLPPIELLYNTSENHRAIAEAVQQMWRKNLGVAVTLTNQEWKVYLDTIHTSHAFQIARAGWIAEDPHLLFDRWETGNTNNNAGWSSATYDQLLKDSLTATSDGRFEIYKQMEKLLADEMPVAPVYFATMPRLVSPKVLGFRTTLVDSYPWKDVDLAR